MTNTRTLVLLLLGAIFFHAPGRLYGQAEIETQDVEQQGEQPSFYADEATLREYIEEALARNPTVQQALARYRSSLEKATRVSGFPDPVVSFNQAIRSIETRVGPQLNSIQVVQKLPWFGKLDLEGKVAVQDAEANYQLYLAQQRQVIAELKRAFYDLAYVDTALRITREEKILLEHYESLARARYVSGQGLQQAVLKMQAEITKAIYRLEILTQQRLSLEARLNTLMDRSPQESIPAAETPSLPEVSTPLEELYELGEEHRQELKAAEARIVRSERAVDLSKKGPWPDIFIGAGFVNVGRRGDPAGLEMPPPDNGKNAFSLSVGLTIPLWQNKHDAAVQEATEGLSAERHQYSNLRNEMELAIRDLVVRLETLQRQVDLFENALIPQAEETLRSTEAAYETGQLGVLDLLDGERVLLELRLVNARFYSDYLGALAALERAVGTRYPTS